ncbi:MAG: ATP-grasp domain-containing protein, partial [Planctomycetaceae bacterium]|nr:ATP-grasp domain-containing protein [Planctomycetaceae bacterium]
MTPILPGATLGLLGSGQLGRMFAIAARRLGYRVEVFSPDSDTPAGQVADVEWVHSYDDAAAIDRFAQAVDVVTLEFENIDTECVRRLEQHVPVRPGALTLHTAQHRSREKNALRKLGLTTAPFHVVRSAEELAKHLAELGEGILKTAAFGYDGKGQQRLTSANDAALVWAEFATDEAVLEGIVDFACEFSVIGVRGVDGEFRAYDPILNTHRHHILDVSSSPALPVSREVADRAIAMTETVMVGLETIGVLCVEFFLTRSGEAVINEIAPRP